MYDNSCASQALHLRDSSDLCYPYHTAQIASGSHAVVNRVNVSASMHPMLISCISLLVMGRVFSTTSLERCNLFRKDLEEWLSIGHFVTCTAS